MSFDPKYFSFVACGMVDDVGERSGEDFFQRPEADGNPLFSSSTPGRVPVVDRYWLPLEPGWAARGSIHFWRRNVFRVRPPGEGGASRGSCVVLAHWRGKYSQTSFWEPLCDALNLYCPSSTASKRTESVSDRSEHRELTQSGQNSDF